MPFEVAPTASNFPPQAPAATAQFIQFQWNGVNLGGPDADTVNFVGTGFTVTRGGADGNTVTVTLA
jgi:hypothetical protein